MKRSVKLLISLAVRAGDIIRNGFLRLAGRKPRGTGVILYYHAVPAEDRESFARQMDVLVRLAKPVPADLPSPLEEGVHHCAVTFDDGFVSVLENALPELERRRIPSTIFVPSGSLGGPPKWIKDATSPTAREVVLTAAQLAGLAEREGLTIASHSISHPNFLTLDESEAQRELSESKSALEQALGKPVTLFSFPHGKYNPSLIERAKAAGYSRVFTIAPEQIASGDSRFAIGRVAAEPTDSLLELRLKILGAYRWLAKRQRA